MTLLRLKKVACDFNRVLASVDRVEADDQLDPERYRAATPILPDLSARLHGP
eukprot:GDKH01025439.1.p3 GENE.GDKH01025439.1~~GDKH01025439.1.p3  ORF type:complete len:52 (-),score=3.95 GDKH01025439.1:365-520(-)